MALHETLSDFPFLIRSCVVDTSLGIVSVTEMRWSEGPPTYTIEGKEHGMTIKIGMDGEAMRELIQWIERR